MSDLENISKQPQSSNGTLSEFALAAGSRETATNIAVDLFETVDQVKKTLRVRFVLLDRPPSDLASPTRPYEQRVHSQKFMLESDRTFVLRAPLGRYTVTLPKIAAHARRDAIRIAIVTTARDRNDMLDRRSVLATIETRARRKVFLELLPPLAHVVPTAIA